MEPKQFRQSSSASLVEGPGVERIHFFRVLRRDLKSRVTVMAGALEVLDKSARVLVVVLTEGDKPCSAQCGRS